MDAQSPAYRYLIERFSREVFSVVGCKLFECSWRVASDVDYGISHDVTDLLAEGDVEFGLRVC